MSHKENSLSPVFHLGDHHLSPSPQTVSCPGTWTHPGLSPHRLLGRLQISAPLLHSCMLLREILQSGRHDQRQITTWDRQNLPLDVLIINPSNKSVTQCSCDKLSKIVGTSESSQLCQEHLNTGVLLTASRVEEKTGISLRKFGFKMVLDEIKNGRESFSFRLVWETQTSDNMTSR